MSSSWSLWAPPPANSSNNERRFDEEAIPLSPHSTGPESFANRPSTSDSSDYDQYNASTPYIHSFSAAGAQGKLLDADDPYASDGNDQRRYNYRHATFSASSRHWNQRAESEVNPHEKQSNPFLFGPAPDNAYLPNGVESDAEYARKLYEEEQGAARDSQIPKSAAPPKDGKVSVLKSKVARQFEKRAAISHRPYFTWTVSALQVLLLIAGFYVNYTLTGSVTEIVSRNPMIGPSGTVLINMGARYAPCMRTVPFIDSTTLVPCPNCTDPTSLAQQICTIDELCGFGGFPPNQPNQWFRFFIPIFLHGGILHLVFNLMFQWNTGRDLEKDMGSIRFGLIYMISGVGGFIFGANFAELQSVSVGASGALFGLVGCLLLDLLQNWKIVVKPIKQLCKMLAIIVISFGIGLLPGFDNFAHIGGFLSGLISGIILLPRINFGKWDKRVKIGSMLIAIPLLVVIFVFTLTNFYNTTRNPTAVCPWCKYLNCLPVNGWCDSFDISSSRQVN